MENNNYMKDCVHLHACRRIGKLEGNKVRARGCNENCTAYEKTANIDLLYKMIVEIGNDYAYYLDDDHNWALIADLKDAFIRAGIYERRWKMV